MNGMKTTQRNFDALIARNYPAVYSFASRLTDDPREAIVLTRDAFNTGPQTTADLGDQTAVATVLLSAVTRAGLTAAEPLDISKIVALISPLWNGLATMP